MEEIIKKLDKKFKILNYEYIDENLVITVTRTNKSDVCPGCGKKSNNVHSRYFRTIKDLPIQENKVILKIKAKVFFCKNPKCVINTFAEQFNCIEGHSRMTTRLKNRIIDTSKGMSARASKSVVNNGIANISDDTILRLIKKNSNNNR